MKISTMMVVMAIAIPFFSFDSFPATKSGKVEMRLSFPFLKKKFPLCRDSSLLARIVIYNRTDTVVTFLSEQGLPPAVNVAFEIETSTSKYIVEKKENGNTGFRILFPGDSVVINYLLTSQSCQPTAFTRRIPKPADGLKSIRAILLQRPSEEEEDLKTASYNEPNNATPLTAPGPDKQRNAVKREDGAASGEVARSVFNGTLTSNLVKF